jgi:hypothetical protein
LWATPLTGATRVAAGRKRAIWEIRLYMSGSPSWGEKVAVNEE